MGSKGKKFTKTSQKAREPVDVERLWHIWNMNGPDLSLACEICSLLKQNELLYELDIFLRNLPLEEEYLVNETLNRARIKVAFWRGDFESVYSTIKVRQTLLKFLKFNTTLQRNLAQIRHFIRRGRNKHIRM